MKAKDLLSQLSRMEQSLHDFSYEEIAFEEAVELKKTFETFRKKLENKIFQPSLSTTINDPNEFLETSEPPTDNSATFESNMLIAKVSHEIRTPLNGIIGFTDLLSEDNDLNKGQLEQVMAIQKASYSLMEIINELLEFSKLSAGAEVFEFVDFNFRNLIGDVMYLCNTLVADKDVDLNVTIDKRIPKVLLGDPSKLTQVLLNLVGNAIKFVDNGHIDLVIHATKRQDNRTLLNFTIADGGIGISEENLKHIFDSYKQAETDTYKTYGGTGLGLSIVKQIITQLGGEIDVTSNLGVGTTFEFSIPFEIGNVDNLIKKDQAHAEISSEEKELVHGMRILVFEDNVLNQRLIEQRLHVWACKTYITDNAQYGLHILTNHKIDLVLMDLKMPGMSGFEITKLIRSFEKPESHSIPIVALSADFSAQDQEQCNQCGIDDFILKPYNSWELLQKLIENTTKMKAACAKTPAPFDSKPIENEGNNKSVNRDAYKIDLSGILDDCLGQVELLEELIFLFKQNALEFIGNVLIHLKNADSEQIGFAAHKIKSGLKMMQSKRLLHIVEQMQECCHSDQDITKLQGMYDSFLVEYPILEKTIDTAMGKILKSKG